MTRSMLLLAAGAMALSPTTILAAPSNGQGAAATQSAAAQPAAQQAPTTQSSSGQGSTNGAGWDHQNGPDSTGQPGAECGDEDALFSPGNASTAPGSAFNEDGTAHGVYAGEQDQNSRNTASVAQYDTACLRGPQPQ